MIRSTDRFLTTHTGSLPRPDDLIRMMYAKEEGVPVDRDGARGAHPRRGRRGGAASRPRPASTSSTTARCRSRATRPTSRTGSTGFGGTGNTFVYQDLADFPNLAKRVFGDPGRSRRKTPACNAPISVRDAAGGRRRRRQPQGRVRPSVKAHGVLHERRLARRGVAVLPQRPLQRATRTICFAIAEAMRHEYETVANAGIVLQIDCPDLAMGRHIQYADLDARRVPQARAAARRGAQPRDCQHPARAAAHARVLGQLRGPAPLRRAARRHHRHRVPGAAERDLVRGRQPAPRARVDACSRRVKLPDGKVLIPGVIESKSNFIEHPELIAQRIGRYANLVGRENVIAGSDCGYGTWVGQAAVDPDVVWAKLAAMAEGARLASRGSSGHETRRG